MKVSLKLIKLLFFSYVILSEKVWIQIENRIFLIIDFSTLCQSRSPLVIVAATLRLWQARSLPMSVEDEGKVEVDANNQRSDHEEDLCGTAWKDGALVEVCLAVGLVFFISFGAFFLSLILVLVSSNFFSPFLRHPTNLICEQYVADKNVAVHDQVENCNEWHA